MKTWVRDRALVLANIALFVSFFVGMAVTGFSVYNNDQSDHGSAPVSFGQYLLTGDFVEATFENWESEFLQMGMYVVLTAFLIQKGPRSRRTLTTLRRTRTPPRQGTVPTRPGLFVAAAGC